MEKSEQTSAKETKEVKKELPSNLQKICVVCGDRALSYNFNVISCESCKAFFRRNALTSKEFKCPFTNNCEITVVTRRFCQKCRLEKCLSVGMVKEFIMSDEDKAEKRKKIEENRAKKRKNVDNDEPVTSSKKREDNSSQYTPNCESGVIQYDNLTSSCSPSSTIPSEISNSEIDSSIQSPPPMYNSYMPVQNVEYGTYQTYPGERYMEVYPMNDNMQYQHSTVDSFSTDSNLYEEKQNSIKSILMNGEASMTFTESKVQEQSDAPSTSADPSVDKAREILQDVERIEPNSIESILCEAIKLEFEAYTSIGSCNRSSRELNEVERAKLNELIVANKALHAPIDDDVSQLVGANTGAGFKEGDGKHHPELITLVNLTAIAIRRLIKMAKKINAFKNMCEEDQVALLKGGCLEMMVLRSTMNYDGQRNSWNIPKEGRYESIKTDVLKFARNNIYQAHESFIRSFEPRWRNDEQLILIMNAILLFTPDRARVVHRDVIKLEQNSYYYLLRRYLESVYPGCEAKSTFLKLIQKIGELHKLCEVVTDVYLEVNPIEPLLIEIFDLKHHPM